MEEEAALYLAPGEIFQWDYRTPQGKAYAKSSCFDRAGSPLKMMTWNIERGYKMKEIIAELKTTNADIICLQEIDSGCSRSQYIDTGIAIAKALQMQYVFQSEFIELGSGSGSPGAHGQDGVHGNCIITRFDIKETSSIDHIYQPYNWDRDGHLFNEPRVGRRFTLCAIVQVPAIFSLQYTNKHVAQQDLQTTTITPRFFNVATYTCHMELFCGATDRLRILSEVFAHSKEMFAKGYLYQLLCGDFNTLAHSIARFSPNYCKDLLRVGSVGWSESEWLTSHVLDYYYDDAMTDIAIQQPALMHDIFTHKTKKDAKDTTLLQSALHNTRLAQMNLGLEESVLKNIINPGFEEVFAANTETLTNYSGWFYGKLDYLLTRGWSITAKEVRNNSYIASDHKSLVVEGFLDSGKLYTCGKIYYREVLGDVTVDDCGETIQYDENKPRTIIVKDSKNCELKYTVLPCAIRGYNEANQGLNGYYQRNCTPFVKICFFIILIVILLLDIFVF